MTSLSNIKENVFLYSINVSYILYFLVLIGVGNFAPYYLDLLKNFLKIFVGALLFIRYNPITYKEKRFSEFDRRLVFSSSIFLLLSTALLRSIETKISENASNILRNNINIPYMITKV
tara:strand:- start:428 stop:781 length:354 start_codon:yes stop_codon:yes gene_type:complete